METELAGHLKQVAAAYAGARRLELSTVGRIAAGDWRFFDRLDDPTKTFTARKYDEIIAWFSANWPADASWPNKVPRPASELQGAA